MRERNGKWHDLEATCNALFYSTSSNWSKKICRILWCITVVQWQIEISGRWMKADTSIHRSTACTSNGEWCYANHTTCSSVTRSHLSTSHDFMTLWRQRWGCDAATAPGRSAGGPSIAALLALMNIHAGRSAATARRSAVIRRSLFGEFVSIRHRRAT